MWCASGVLCSVPSVPCLAESVGAQRLMIQSSARILILLSGQMRWFGTSVGAVRVCMPVVLLMHTERSVASIELPLRWIVCQRLQTLLLRKVTSFKSRLGVLRVIQPLQPLHRTQWLSSCRSALAWSHSVAIVHGHIAAPRRIVLCPWLTLLKSYTGKRRIHGSFG